MKPTECLLFVARATLATAFEVRADEKPVLLDDVPRTLSKFEVSASGSRLYFGSGSYYVFDAKGKLVNRFGLSRGAGRVFVPRPVSPRRGCCVEGVPCYNMAGIP